MVGAKKSTWIGGTVFVALVLAAAAWFLAISPTMSAAADVRGQAEDTRAQNEILAMRVTKLKSDFKKLPEYKEELAAIQTQIPTDAALSEYLRELDGIAAAHSVTLTAIAPSVPTAVVVAAPAAPAPAPTDSAAPTDGSTAAPVAETPSNGAPAGFTAIPFSITALGTYDNTVAFLYDLQNATPRLFLVGGITATAQEESPAGGGKPATAVGDQELVITGFTYVLADPLAVPPAVDPNAAAPVLPGPSGKNPLVPITGH